MAPGHVHVGHQHTIADLVKTTSTLKTLYAALEAADLTTTFMGPGPLTLFAPTDAAFAALPAGLLTDLLKPEHATALRDLLLGHAVQGSVFSRDVKDQQKITTLSGTSVTAAVNSAGLSVDGSKVTTPDVSASNGVVHVVNTVVAAYRPVLQNFGDVTTGGTYTGDIYACDREVQTGYVGLPSYCSCTWLQRQVMCGLTKQLPKQYVVSANFGRNTTLMYRMFRKRVHWESGQCRHLSWRRLLILLSGGGCAFGHTNNSG